MRKIAQWLLISLVAAALLCGGWFLFMGLTIREDISDPNLLITMGGVFLGCALFLFFFARWLGRQEDFEESH